ncbi:MAG: MFS transporter [Candidatus Hodarchaeota archaeon]
MCAEIETTKFPTAKALSYSMGPFINSFIYFAYDLLVFYYYEVELGLATAYVGISFVIFALWNMFNDPLVGFITDKPKRWSKKYGLRAPWIIFGGILQIIVFFFLFFIPFDYADPKTNPLPLFIYMVIVTCIWDTFFSIFMTNYVGGFANVFRTPDNRRKGSLVLLLIGMFGNVFASGVIVPMVIVYGDPTSYIRGGALACIVLAIALLLFIPGIYENEEVKTRYLRIHEIREKQKLPYKELLKIAFKNKDYVIYVTMFTLWITATLMNRLSTLYLIKDVLNEDITILGPGTLIFMIGFIPFMFVFTYVAKKTEHIYVTIIAVLLLACNLVLLMFITTATQWYIIRFIGGVASAAWGGILFSITSDVMDSVCIDAEQHVESTMIGIRTFFLRISYLIGGAIIAAIHIATGYVPGASQQSDLAILGIRLHTGLIPAIMLFVAGFLLIKFYTLKGDRKRECMETLRAKGL